MRGTVAAPDTVVDPEALIHLTAALADVDPRLWDEAANWWRRLPQYVSKSRLTQIGARFDEKLRTRVAATMETRRVPASGKIDNLRNPARSLLRFRCAFGMNARAEVLLALLTDWADIKDGVTALTLAEVGYSKRNIAAVMEELTLSGLVIATPDANRIRYRLANPDLLRRLLGPIPRVGGSWHRRMPIIAHFVELSSRLRDKDAMVQAAVARKALTAQESSLRSLHLDHPRIATAESYWDGVQRWLIDEVIHVPTDDHRELAGQMLGIWLGPGDAARAGSQPNGAVLPPMGSDVTTTKEMTCLDLVQVSTIDPPGDWTWLVLSEAAMGTYQHTVGLQRGERWRFATRVAGEDRMYRARLAPPLRPADITSIYGVDSAGRARRDHAAVRIQLTLE
ncbi:MAG TPA: hypothetical protein VHE35_26380 [Kofleriaceae bacterium]|nr:hypothetical protein [Kofleriaceae bacterium]